MITHNIQFEDKIKHICLNHDKYGWINMAAQARLNLHLSKCCMLEITCRGSNVIFQLII